ncbi:hypothetical protein K469DRAFT_682070 [Zopfia rhizophila CBS 207.26]|uniref:Uncharacterized protein n=1 Tax=Zopfia rhizophila CBS 207.26 TaxID=1314779 RepID=A0A6A6EYG9_9PEZI|nr:hypothetical protein K469DRAFT_682070 [Zopfia rhizophila CBS 207.26]
MSSDLSGRESATLIALKPNSTATKVCLSAGIATAAPIFAAIAYFLDTRRGRSRSSHSSKQADKSSSAEDLLEENNKMKCKSDAQPVNEQNAKSKPQELPTEINILELEEPNLGIPELEETLHPSRVERDLGIDRSGLE